MRGARSTAALIAAAVLVAACGGAQPSAAPTAAPTPVVTPNPHLPSPATAQQVFSGLGKAGVRITANTASLGAEGSDVVTKIYATYLGWPLDVTQYSSTTALSKVTEWPADEPPGKGEPAVALAGMNILITWGPTVSGAKPGKPDGRQSDGLRELVSALDPLLSPLRARAIVPVAIAGQVATAPSPEASAPAQ
jgi:hypothetical protein